MFPASKFLEESRSLYEVKRLSCTTFPTEKTIGENNPSGTILPSPTTFYLHSQFLEQRRLESTYKDCIPIYTPESWFLKKIHVSECDQVCKHPTFLELPAIPREIRKGKTELLHWQPREEIRNHYRGYELRDNLLAQRYIRNLQLARESPPSNLELSTPEVRILVDVGEYGLRDIDENTTDIFSLMTEEAEQGQRNCDVMEEISSSPQKITSLIWSHRLVRNTKGFSYPAFKVVSHLIVYEKYRRSSDPIRDMRDHWGYDVQSVYLGSENMRNEKRTHMLENENEAVRAPYICHRYLGFRNISTNVPQKVRGSLSHIFSWRAWREKNRTITKRTMKCAQCRHDEPSEGWAKNPPSKKHIFLRRNEIYHIRYLSRAWAVIADETSIQ